MVAAQKGSRLRRGHGSEGVAAQKKSAQKKSAQNLTSAAVGFEEALALRPIRDLIGDGGVKILDVARGLGGAGNHDVGHGSDIMRQVCTGLVDESWVERDRRGLS